jgi:hypothetical protein
MRATMMYVLAWHFLSLSLSSLHLDQTIDIKSLEHKREVKKKTRSGDRKMRKMLKTASKVRPFPLVL